MDINTSLKNSIMFSSICSITFIIIFVFALCNDVISKCDVLSVPGIIFLVPSAIAALSVTCLGGYGYSEKNNKYLLQARALAAISTPFLIFCLFLVYSSTREIGRCFGGVFTFFSLVVSEALLAASFIPLRTAIELHVKNEGLILPMSDFQRAYEDIRSWFVEEGAGVANVVNMSSIVIKVKRRGDKLYREIEISHMFESTLAELKALIAAKFDHNAEEIHQLIQNNDKIIENDEDVNRLTKDDFIEALFHEPEVTVRTPLLDQAAYNAPPLYTTDMNV